MFVKAVDDTLKDHLHRRGNEFLKDTPDSLPEFTLALTLGFGGLKQGATQLLHLVNQKRQHHQVRKHRAQMLLAQAVVVLKVVSLVFQRVEGLILDAPPGTTGITASDLSTTSR